ncbi:MAG TPA: hypothetical protein VME22_22765 [Solirubrobacteraceae bacterium]|nr:hypothetical protein [Solirubrobacteraceae bacterium]
MRLARHGRSRIAGHVSHILSGLVAGSVVAAALRADVVAAALLGAVALVVFVTC